VIVAGDEIARNKPHREIYLCVAEKLDVASEVYLVIENALSSIAAANAANMRVAPDTRFVDRREYGKEGDYVLGSL
jgi:beta-phosphoglucomutase-like phosphatase (HAD superfamily)